MSKEKIYSWVEMTPKLHLHVMLTLSSPPVLALSPVLMTKLARWFTSTIPSPSPEATTLLASMISTVKGEPVCHEIVIKICKAPHILDKTIHRHSRYKNIRAIITYLPLCALVSASGHKSLPILTVFFYKKYIKINK